MRDIMDTVEQWLHESKPVALATVAATWGSSPRQAGAKMAVTRELAMVGSVSGGCVESAVAEAAVEIIADGKPRLLTYGVSDDVAWEVGLACGGKVSVYVEPLDLAWWRAATSVIRNQHALVTVTVIAGAHSGQKVMFDLRENSIIYSSSTLEPAQQEALIQAVKSQRTTGRAVFNGLEILVDVVRPDPRLVIVGGAHVSQVLAKFALMMGYGVIIIDPRAAFATAERFPGVSMLSHDYPDKVLPGLAIDSETYIAVLTHDPKIDDPALRAALPSPAPYVGVMSGKRSHELRIERLTQAGVSAALIGRIHVPIGLSIGARLPEEVALSIMAEIVATKNASSSSPDTTSKMSAEMPNRKVQT